MENHYKPNKQGFPIGMLFWVLFILEILILAVITSMAIANQSIYNSLSHSQQNAASSSIAGDVVSIFTNNFKIATILTIPIIGPIFFIFSMIATALELSAEAAALNYPGWVVFVSLALLPHTWLELPAYAIAAANSIFLIYALAKRGPLLKARLIRFVKIYAFVGLELLVAAIFESVIIYMENNPALNNSFLLYIIILWIPAAIALILLTMLFRSISRGEYRGNQVEPAPQGNKEPEGWNRV
ncbi:MAG: stage II sporulation protein M [Candidatus Thermoplasmatota archaeon]|nr:stage II sporulation protein M [Candidatus Thermoplasmatota archaeon]